MTIRKPLCFIAILACCLTSSSSNADGQKYRGMNSGMYTGQYTSPRHSQTSPPGRVIGPVTSFSNAYGPVPAIGLRNYSWNRNTDSNHRHSGFTKDFNSRQRDKNTKRRLVQEYRNVFGYTSNPSHDDQD